MDKKDIKILLIDDEPDILEIVKYNLENENYQVYTAKNGISGIKKAKKIIPDLIISDIMMPEMDGIEVCEEIRNHPPLSETIVVFLTARGEDYSVIAGFDAGADDYIHKPIKPKVLVKKVESLLRRVTKEKKTTQKELKIKDLILDKEAYKVVKKGKEIQLPRKEFELLSLLISQPGRVFRREEILLTVWGRQVVVGDRTIDVHISKLREKIGDKHFTTIKGVGYKYVI